MRGTLPVSPPLCRSRRFIPACAGNTRNLARTTSRSSVHPRLCGEHTSRHHLDRFVRGSSPPVRGTLINIPPRHQKSRFIPACAGNTSMEIVTRFGEGFIPACAGNTKLHVGCAGALSVHPRLCGEHLPPRAESRGATGSSPPVRGTRVAAYQLEIIERFIPACAGNTPCPRSAKGPEPVHPRLCGEHQFGALFPDIEVGSSPPVRGTLQSPFRWRYAIRFIPACAGNTVRGDLAHAMRPVHPRLCGEHALRVLEVSGVHGSSPPVRGTPWQVAFLSGCCRFIPACAGNTKVEPCEKGADSVHPRLCGEHALP